MATVVGIRYTKAGPVQLVDATDWDLRLGEKVVARTPKGLEMGTVVSLQEDGASPQAKGALVRRASFQDLEQEASLRQRNAEAVQKAREKITEHGLPMRLLAGQWTLDGGYVTLTFWAADRVDFRTLVRDLGRLFQARVELHQVGTRERAKLVGGIGRCGRVMCCSTWQVNLQQVTVQMAKEQELLQSMPELTGSCGRLLCCLRYEYQDYLLGKTGSPPPGERVMTPQGAGTVVKRDLMRDRVTVRLEGTEVLDYPAKAVTSLTAEAACEECAEAPPANSNATPGTLQK